MSRTTMELQSNDNITNEQIIQEILTSHNYKQVTKKDETYWKCGVGMVTAPKCIKYTFINDKLILEGWIKNYGIGESALSGPVGMIPKKSCQKVLNEISTKINTQKTPINTNNNQSANINTQNQQNNIINNIQNIIENNRKTIDNQIQNNIDNNQNNKIDNTNVNPTNNIQDPNVNANNMHQDIQTINVPPQNTPNNYSQNNYNQQQNYNQQAYNQQNYNNNNSNINENSIIVMLFYKKDKMTNQLRIAKVKIFSIILFFLLMLLFIASSYSFYGFLLLEDYIGAFLLSLFITVPVFIIGWIIGKILEGNNSTPNSQINNSQINQMSNSQMNNNQYNQMPNTQYPNQHYNQIHNQNQNIHNNQSIPQNNQNIDHNLINNQKIEVNPIKTDDSDLNAKKYYEKDNLGTNHDTIDKATAYWMGERLQSEYKAPFTMYIFTSASQAEDALLELPYIHKATDSGKLICDDVLIYGYYKVSEDNYEAIICGKALTIEQFRQAEESFEKQGGSRKNNLEPEIINNNTGRADSTTNNKDKKSSVKFREKINKDQFTYECYDADNKKDALEFLKTCDVNQRLYYICVYTPEGDYGKDIDGVYQM